MFWFLARLNELPLEGHPTSHQLLGLGPRCQGLGPPSRVHQSDRQGHHCVPVRAKQVGVGLRPWPRREVVLDLPAVGLAVERVKVEQVEHGPLPELRLVDRLQEPLAVTIVAGQEATREQARRAIAGA